jgi:two-component system chemotaxis response regulator CheB
MDLHMPNMDGFAATKEIMVTAPTPIIIATGSTQAAEVATAIRALNAGALAVVKKPPAPSARGFEEARQKLVSTVEAMAHVRVVRHWRLPAGPAVAAPSQSSGPPQRIVRARVVAIAASTGGPAALQGLLSALPGDFSAPILVVQHITRGFTSGLAAWLNAGCRLRVKIAEDGEPLAPQTVYVAPDDRHLGVSKSLSVALSAAAPVGGFRPSGTFLFESTARVFGSTAVAVVLTGMGDDGVAGLRAARQSGGRVIVQDEESCVVFGMPGAAVAAGLVEQVLSLDKIAPRLVQLCQ